MNNIEKTIQFLNETFNKGEYFKDHPLDKQYRLDHTYRVANYGKEIAEKENLNVEAVIIGCLLHDISYALDFKTEDDWRNHGRNAAKMSRNFVNALDIEEHLKEEILYGIAIHVDDKADFEGNRSILAETIGECDNIDRFDKYRLYEALKHSKLNEMSTQEQIDFCQTKIERLEGLKKYVHKTKTSNDLWYGKLDYQKDYFYQLLTQLKRSDSNLLNK